MPTYDLADLPHEAGLDGEFLSYKTLNGSPNEKEVLLILRRLANLVQPLMRRRGWKVNTLSEMAEPPRVVSKAGAIQTRIGVNYHTAGGSHEISLNVSFCIRRSLKLTRRDGLIRVLLHELTHIKRGIHGPCFYWTYARLRREFLKQLRKRETQVSLYLLWENTNALLIKQWNQAEQVKEVVETERDKSGEVSESGEGAKQS
jgi:hypothetical protein